MCRAAIDLDNPHCGCARFPIRCPMASFVQIASLPIIRFSSLPTTYFSLIFISHLSLPLAVSSLRPVLLPAQCHRVTQLAPIQSISFFLEWHCEIGIRIGIRLLAIAAPAKLQLILPIYLHQLQNRKSVAMINNVNQQSFCPQMPFCSHLRRSGNLLSTFLHPIPSNI